MNAWLVAVTAGLTLSTATVSSANAAMPAWQEPGFVMEEVVVTAIVRKAVLSAWQEPGFVMEEVVATATVEDVANAWREQMHRRARIEVALRASAQTSE